MNRERGIKPDPVGMYAKESRTDSMEGPGPSESIRYGRRSIGLHLTRDPLHPSGHFICSSPRKSHEKDAPGIDTVKDQVGNTMSEGVSLACSSACNDEKWHARRSVPGLDTIFYGPSLFCVELIEIIEIHSASMPLTETCGGDGSSTSRR